MADVIVVGSGPTGMMLAGELALAGIEVGIVEQRSTPDILGSRAGGFHSRTIEIFDQRGIAERFLSAGTVAQTARFGTTVLDISDFPTRHPYGLALWQNAMEPILASWVDELGVRTEWAREVTSLAQDEDGVDVHFADGTHARTRYLVGADGGRSAIRKAAAIDFPGWDATRSNLVAEVQLRDAPPSGIRHDEYGVHGISPLADGGSFRVVTTERQLRASGEPKLAHLSAALTAVFGTDFGVHAPTWISRFTDATRQAASYRSGRVLVAGDAAHIHYPAGGQGIGLGIQDAVNLGWKLAQVVKGTSPESLLDSFQAERHPAAARALKHSMAQTVLQRSDPRTAAITQTVDGFMGMTEPRTQVAALIHGLDIVYDLGGGALDGAPVGDPHPLLGRRMPDLDLTVADGSTRVFALLRDAEPLLLNFAVPGQFDIQPWSDRVRLVDARTDDRWRLPVIGEVTAPGAVLVRPDGHVGWIGHGTDAGLVEALTLWFGPPR